MKAESRIHRIALLSIVATFYGSHVWAIPPTPADLRASSIKTDKADLSLDYVPDSPSALSSKTMKNTPSDLSLIYAPQSPTSLNVGGKNVGKTVDLRYSPVSPAYMNAASIRSDKNDMDLAYSLVSKAYHVMSSQFPAAPNLNLIFNTGTRTYLSSRFMRPQSSALNSNKLSNDKADLDL